jgi:hypothetical protein
MPTCQPVLPQAVYVLAVIENKMRELVEMLKVDAFFNFDRK